MMASDKGRCWTCARKVERWELRRDLRGRMLCARCRADLGTAPYALDADRLLSAALDGQRLSLAERAAVREGPA